MFERFFRLSENNTSIRTEVVAGITTFLTMAYIVVLQPAILSGGLFGFETGLDFRSVMAATCISAALATLFMGLYARYPIALAPGMGENFVFVFALLPAAGGLAAVVANETTAWQVGLGVIFISGVLFLFLSLLGIRERIIDAVSPSMKNAMAVGIGLFIAFIALQNAGVVLKDPGTAVKLNPHFASPDLIVFFFGLMLTSILHVRGVRGSILIGIAATTVFSLLLHAGFTHGMFGTLAESKIVAESKLMTMFSIPDSSSLVPQITMPTQTFMALDVPHALSLTMIPFIILFLFMDVFDTLGTLIGVSEQAGFLKDNKLPRAQEALLADSVGTVAGAVLGTSTVTSFIESASGVEQGGRTGLTSVVVAILFLLALFFAPLAEMMGSYPPITAAALVLVGTMMIRNVNKIDWDDYSEAVPAFITLVGIPFFYSIADGLALGFMSYPVIKLFSGKASEVKWLMYVLAIVLLAYFLFVRAAI